MARFSPDSVASRHSAPPLEGDINLPIYRRLYQTFARRITAGEWKPGDGLPAELDLARAYHIAPGTVRRAIDDLVESRLVERKHGLGTYVARPNFDNAMLRFFRFRDETGMALLPESRIVSREVVRTPAHVAHHLGLKAPSVLCLIRHRLWDGATRLVEDIYLPLGRFRPLLNANPEDIGPLLYPVYERLCGEIVFSIDEEISIIEAGLDDAQVLGCASGDLVVSVERIARNALGEPIEWRVSRGQARRFRYKLTFGLQENGDDLR